MSRTEYALWGLAIYLLFVIGVVVAVGAVTNAAPVFVNCEARP